MPRGRRNDGFAPYCDSAYDLLHGFGCLDCEICAQQAKSTVSHDASACLVLGSHARVGTLSHCVALPARQPAYTSAHPNVVELVGASFPRRDVDFDNSILATPVAGPPSTAFSIAKCAVLAWLLGIAVVVAYFAKQYKALISNIPLGQKLTHPQWQEEWSRISDEIGVPTKTQFRLTDDVGPLCCYVPFFYLILAPERLWSSFQPTQREFILRP